MVFVVIRIFLFEFYNYFVRNGYSLMIRSFGALNNIGIFYSFLIVFKGSLMILLIPDQPLINQNLVSCFNFPFGKSVSLFIFIISNFDTNKSKMEH